MVWTYMGRARPAAAAGLAAQPRSRLPGRKRLQECNYMQALEGDIDTVHAASCTPVTARPRNLMGSDEYYTMQQPSALRRAGPRDRRDLRRGAPGRGDTEYWRRATSSCPSTP